MDYKYKPSTSEELKLIILDITYNNLKNVSWEYNFLELKKETFFKKYSDLSLKTKAIINDFFDELFHGEYAIKKNIYDIISQYWINDPIKYKEIIKNDFFSKFHNFFYNYKLTEDINEDVIENILDYYISQIPNIYFTKHLLIDFNIIDVSIIEDFSNIFEEFKLYCMRADINFPWIQIQFDVSKWNMSSATDLSNMFSGINVGCDISNWDVSNVISMKNMFRSSFFNGNISNWDVSKVTNMSWMFYDSDFNGDISHWNMKNVEDINEIFAYSKFIGDLTLWELDNLITMDNAFLWTKLHFDISLWYTPKLKEYRKGLEYLYKYNFDVSEFYRYTKRKAKVREHIVLSTLSNDEINKFWTLPNNLVYIKYLWYGYFSADYYNENDKDDLHSDVKQWIYNYYTNEVILMPKYDYIGDIDDDLNANIIIWRYRYSWNWQLTIYYWVFNLNKKETITKIRYEDIQEIERIKSQLGHELINNIKIRESNIDLDYVFNHIKKWEKVTEEIKIWQEESEKNLKRFEQIKEQIANLEKELLEIKQKEEEKYNVLKDKIERQKDLEEELKNKYNLNIVDALNLIKQAKDNDFD